MSKNTLENDKSLDKPILEKMSILLQVKDSSETELSADDELLAHVFPNSFGQIQSALIENATDSSEENTAVTEEIFLATLQEKFEKDVNLAPVEMRGKLLEFGKKSEQTISYPLQESVYRAIRKNFEEMIGGLTGTEKEVLLHSRKLREGENHKTGKVNKKEIKKGGTDFVRLNPRLLNQNEIS